MFNCAQLLAIVYSVSFLYMTRKCIKVAIAFQSANKQTNKKKQAKVMFEIPKLDHIYQFSSKIHQLLNS